MAHGREAHLTIVTKLVDEMRQARFGADLCY